MTKAVTYLAIMSLMVSGAVVAEQRTSRNCYPDWSVAAEIVKSKSLASAKSVHDLVRSKTGGRLARITLCTAKGRYLYRLVILDTSGRSTNLSVDAAQPFTRSVVAEN